MTLFALPHWQHLKVYSKDNFQWRTLRKSLPLTHALSLMCVTAPRHPSQPLLTNRKTGDDDADSAYAEGSESDTTSIASSVLNYTYENGRRYSAHGIDQYVILFFALHSNSEINLS